jgi:hypothetical protein
MIISVPQLNGAILLSASRLTGLFYKPVKLSTYEELEVV